ncbi:hypothetical protein HDV00_001662 [Rhizophlyctis rosea]|nr:hypothetical protein HDV00_001662 [Rhizophlyctis rosea]
MEDFHAPQLWPEGVVAPRYDEGNQYQLRRRTTDKPKTVPGQNSYTAVEDDNAKAAIGCRLLSDHMTEKELETFPIYATPRTNRKVYLRVRNWICSQWLKTPSQRLSLAPLLAAIREGCVSGVRDEELVTDAYNFLDRHRYINFGILPEPGCAAKQVRGRRPKIVVIGAGIAGVTAAREIMNIYANQPGAMPPEVVLLEGRKRVGGRIFTFPLHTREKGMSEPQGVDLGRWVLVGCYSANRALTVSSAAQIVTGFDGGNPLDPIMKHQLKLKLHYLVNANDCKLYDSNGKEADPEADDFANKVFNSVLEQSCYTVIENGEPRLVRGKRPRQEPYPKGKGENPSLGQIFEYHLERHPSFGDLTPLNMRLIHWHLANLEFANAATVDRLSLQHWDQDDGYEFGGDHAMIPGGYGQLPHAYAFGGKPLNIQFGKAVDRIAVERTNGGQDDADMRGMVKVICKDGSEHRCDAVVVTVPLGVLKHRQIAFDPPLPLWKQKAIDNLEMGLFNKLVLVFPRMFWPNKSGDVFGSLSNPAEGKTRGEVAAKGGSYDPAAYASVRGRLFLFWNLYPTTKLPILVAFISGEAAREMENKDDKTIVSEAMSTLSTIFPRETPLPSPIETIVTRWSRDEFARGSYSYVAKDATGSDYDKLAETIGGKIYFAGEATNRSYPATVHGAMLSGFRVASQLSDALLGPIQHIGDTHTNHNVSNETVTADSIACPHRCGYTIPPNESVFDHLNTHLQTPAKRRSSPTDESEGSQSSSHDSTQIHIKKRKTTKLTSITTKALKEHMDEHGLGGVAAYNSLVSKWWNEVSVEGKKEYERKAKELYAEYALRTSRVDSLASSVQSTERSTRSSTWYKEGVFKEDSSSDLEGSSSEDVSSAFEGSDA